MSLLCFNFNTFGTCILGQSVMTSVNNFPVCWLFTFFLRLPTETFICGFGIKTQDLPLFMDTERECRHRCSYEESVTKKEFFFCKYVQKKECWKLRM